VVVVAQRLLRLLDEIDDLGQGRVGSDLGRTEADAAAAVDPASDPPLPRPRFA